MLLCLYPEIGNGCFGKRIFEWIQDVFGRGCGQGCRKWCLQSCPMEVLGRLKFSILHFQGSGGEEKGGRKGVRGGSERGQNLCVQKVVEKTNVEISFVFILYLCFGVFRKQACSRGFGSDYRRLCSKSSLKTLEICCFREKHVFVGLRSSPSLFYIKNSQNPPPGTPPGGPILTFLGGEFSLGIVK